MPHILGNEGSLAKPAEVGSIHWHWPVSSANVVKIQRESTTHDKASKQILYDRMPRVLCCNTINETSMMSTEEQAQQNDLIHGEDEPNAGLVQRMLLEDTFSVAVTALHCIAALSPRQPEPIPNV